MAQYACTKCTQWFLFEDLTKDKQLCQECTKASNKAVAAVKEVKRQPELWLPVCKYCKTDVKPKESACERCLKNLNEHGKPKSCAYCKLNSAFIGSKCQRCSSSQKKYGAPLLCGKCGSKSAYNNEKAKIDGKLLCWLCYITVQRKLRRLKRKHEKSVGGAEKIKKRSPSQPISSSGGEAELSQEETWKELLGEKKLGREGKSGQNLRKTAHLNSRRYREEGSKSPNLSNHTLEARLASMKQTFSAPNSPSSPVTKVQNENKPSSQRSTPKSDTELAMTSSSALPSSERRWNGSNLSVGLPALNDQNIVLVTKLREEITGLKRQLAKKEQQLLDKDKQLSLIKVEHLNEVKVIRSKFTTQEDEYIRTVETYRNKNQELLKKIAQISKGKA